MTPREIQKCMRDLRILVRALNIAAEENYKSKIVDTLMEEHCVGVGKEFQSKANWIEEQISEWVKEAKTLVAK